MAWLTTKPTPIDTTPEFRCGTFACMAEEALDEEINKEPIENLLEDGNFDEQELEPSVIKRWATQAQKRLGWFMGLTKP